MAVTAVTAGVAALWGVGAAQAALVGGAVAVLPNAYFAWASVRRGGSAQPAVVEARRLLRRWGGKLALTMALMAVAIVGLGMGSGAFFAGLGLALATQHLAPLVASRGWLRGAGSDSALGTRRRR